MDITTYNAILSTVICLANVAVGISAVCAVFHYVKHRRDDDVQLVVTPSREKPYDTDKRNGVVWRGTIRIVNVGKTPVTITGLEIADKALRKHFAIGLDPQFCQFLDNGAFVQYEAWLHVAGVAAIDKQVAAPKAIRLKCLWERARPEDCGCCVINPVNLSAAGEATKQG